MNDRDFLIWIHERLHLVHGESETVDYMYKLRAVIGTTRKDKVSPSMGACNSLKEFLKDNK